MKTKYLIAGIAVIAAAFHYLKARKGGNSSNREVIQDRLTVNGQRHIRAIMNKSKLAV